MSNDYMKPFIEAIAKLHNTDNEEIFHIHQTNINKLKTIANSIKSINEEFDEKGFITEQNHKKLQRIFGHINVIQEQDEKYNADT